VTDISGNKEWDETWEARAMAHRPPQKVVGKQVRKRRPAPEVERKPSPQLMQTQPKIKFMERKKPPTPPMSPVAPRQGPVVPPTPDNRLPDEVRSRLRNQTPLPVPRPQPAQPPAQPPAPPPPAQPPAQPQQPPAQPAQPVFVPAAVPQNVHVAVPQVQPAQANEEKQNEADALDRFKRQINANDAFVGQHFEYHRLSDSFRAKPQRQYFFQRPVYQFEQEYTIPNFVQKEEVEYDKWDFHYRESYDNPDPSTSYRRFKKYNQENFPLYNVTGGLTGTLGEFFRFKGDSRTIHIYKVNSPPQQAISILAKRIFEHGKEQLNVRLLTIRRYRGKNKLVTLVSTKRLQSITESDLSELLRNFFTRSAHLILKQTSNDGTIHQLLRERHSIL